MKFNVREKKSLKVREKNYFDPLDSIFSCFSASFLLIGAS